VVVSGLEGNGATTKKGARYDPVSDSWSALKDHPKDRYAPRRRHGWTAYTGALALHAGGFDANDNMKPEVERYQPSNDTWLTKSNWLSTKDHEWGAVVWTGNELILWSGLDNGSPDPAGDRYKP
jgi:hypothetical protein